MPAYDYECANCGVFTELRSMAEFMMPVECPRCTAQSPRLLISSPSLTGLRPPRWMAQANGTRNGRSRLHPSGCGCCGSLPRVSLKAEAISALSTDE